MSGSRFFLEVRPNIPERLARLKELANDLLYSWDRNVRSLFYRLDPGLWESSGHNPKVFLRRVAQTKLEAAVQDRVFIQDYNRVLSSYDTYREERGGRDVAQHLDRDNDLVAYFCAEFGFHESFPIYSGGLGILAGDHCKAASDLNVPFIAVGMLYRQGYFTQTIDGDGVQQAHYTETDFDDLPVSPALDAAGRELHVRVQMPGREVELKVWAAKAGHITLYLLDSDLESNAKADREITHQLYGGDINTRMQQEIVLGIGGVRAIRALGLTPTVWHINEGHAAFQILERCREQVVAGLEFEAALERIAANTVFTTHTPVPAGHDIFHYSLIHNYFKQFIVELNIDEARFMALGASPGGEESFNQTALALRGSRFHNGVSRIHGHVASEMEGYVWPGIPREENPLSYVTNGVHVPTFLAREWVALFDLQFGGGWRNELLNNDFWEQVDAIPDQSFWSLRQALKSLMLSDIHQRALRQHRRNGCSATQIARLTRFLVPGGGDALMIGFARRFATYKRAMLLFADPERLKRLLNDPQRPVVFIFAGKAHPQDEPGQHLIKQIHDFSRRPGFQGRIVLLEGYDLSLARKLVTGVDVWLNNPEYPLEASGTSGEKAAINGVINLSVLDGWWQEGYNGENGWSITPHDPKDYAFEQRYQEESNELLDLLEEQVIPLYYKRNGRGYSEDWLKISKASMKSILPRFNSARMVMDYVRQFYAPASRQGRAFAVEQARPARELAAWKARVRAAWPQITIRRAETPPGAVQNGDSLPLRVAVMLNGLTPNDVVVECLLGNEDEFQQFEVSESFTFSPDEILKSGETLYKLNMQPELPGLRYYKIRMYPYHPLLCHCYEVGCMLWVTDESGEEQWD